MQLIHGDNKRGIFALIFLLKSDKKSYTRLEIALCICYNIYVAIFRNIFDNRHKISFYFFKHCILIIATTRIILSDEVEKIENQIQES